MRSRYFFAALGIAASFTLLLGQDSHAQTLAGTPRDSRFATRAQLEHEARVALNEQRHADAVVLQTRLREGDFHEGDRIILSIDIPRVLSPDNSTFLALGGIDTTVVRAGTMLQFTRVPRIPDLSLDGVLRSELADTITAHLSKYVRNPSVRATPLLRLGIMGAVGKPGWYLTPSDAVLSDVIMQAGVIEKSNLSSTVVRRDGATIWSSEQVRSALADGRSLDRLNLRAGDEIVVDSKRQWSVMNSVQIVAGLAAIYGVVLTTRTLHK
jgi:protein involved in polysaccharide export with SLBB domain